MLYLTYNIKKIDGMISKLIKNFSVITACILYISFVYIYSYYLGFNFSIINYTSGSDFIFLIFPLLPFVAVLFTLSLIIYGFIKGTFESYFVGIRKLQLFNAIIFILSVSIILILPPASKIGYGFILAGIVILVMFGSCYDEEVLLFVKEGKMPFNFFIIIFFVVTATTYACGLGTSIALRMTFSKIKPFQKVLFRYNNNAWETNDTLRLVAQTRSHIMLYNTTTKYTSIIPFSEIDSFNISMNPPKAANK